MLPKAFETFQSMHIHKGLHLSILRNSRPVFVSRQHCFPPRSTPRNSSDQNNFKNSATIVNMNYTVVVALCFETSHMLFINIPEEAPNCWELNAANCGILCSSAILQ